MIRVRDVSLAPAGSDRLAVRGVSARVDRPGALAILGPTGSGKSTLLRAIAALSPREGGPTIVGGDIELDGTSLRGLGRRDRLLLSASIGYVSHTSADALPGAFTVADIVGEPIFARDANFDRAAAGTHVAVALDRMRLPLGMLDARVSTLSRGQRQRVAMARAIVLEPRVLLVDDPLAGVDALVAPAVLAALRDASASAAVVAVVPSAAHARGLGGDALVLARGGVVGLGPIDALLAQADHPHLVALAEDDEGESGTTAGMRSADWARTRR